MAKSVTTQDLLNVEAKDNPTMDDRKAIDMYDWWNDAKLTKATVNTIKRVAKEWLKQGGKLTDSGWYTKENHAGGHYDQVGLEGVFNVKVYQPGYASENGGYYVALDSEKKYTILSTMHQAIKYAATNGKQI